MKKKISITVIMVVLAMFALVSCDHSDDHFDGLFEGTYMGTISNTSGKAYLNQEGDAIAEISKIGDQTIQVHIYNVDIDTTFMLNYYEDMDNINVCFTGEDFESMYGHMLGQGHMNGGMMNDIGNNETEWMHHLNDEHQEGDEHYGRFNLLNQTFQYEFTKEEDGAMHEFIFNGIKQ